MVITREISEEIQNSIQNALKKLLHDQSFIETLADGVSHIITKTIKDRFFEMEQTSHEGIPCKDKRRT